MSKSAAAVCSAIFAVAAAVTIHESRTFTALSGDGLAVVLGMQRDPHLLTATLWQPVVTACAFSAACVHTYNAAVFALACSLIVFFVCRIGGWYAVALATLAGLIVATSPLAQSNVLAALGGEDSFALLLFIALVSTVAGLWDQPLWVRALLPAAIVLQDPLYTPVAFFFVVATARNRAEIWYPAALVSFVFAGRVALGSPSLPQLLHAMFDPWAGPSTIVLLGIVVFVALPLTFWFYARPLARAGKPSQRSFFFSLLLGIVMAAIAMISPGSDPAPYWLAAECAAVLAFAGCAREGFTPLARFAVAALGIAAIVSQLQYYARAVLAMPAGTLAREATILHSGLEHPSASGMACVVGDHQAATRLTGSGAFVQVYNVRHIKIAALPTIGRCLSWSSGKAQMVAAAYPLPQDVTPNFALAFAWQAAQRSHEELAERDGTLSSMRRVHMPGGHGAYRHPIPTPFGDVPAVTIATSFSYRYDCVRLPERAVLTFAATNPLSSIPGVGTAHFSAYLNRSTILQTAFPPTPERGSPIWTFYSIRLRAGRSACQTIRFKVETDTGPGAGVGIWTTVAAPAISSGPLTRRE